MSTSTIGQYFTNRVEELISEFTGHTLIFFKGFGLEQIRFLITHPNSLLDDASLLHEGFLDLEAIDDRWLDLAASIKSATKPLVGFYEELLAIRQLLPRMKIDKIVVIENNILSPWVPCYFPYSYAEKLFDYWQTEHEPPAGSPLVQLVEMYGDVKLLKEEKALLLPATLDDERIEIVPFWQGCVVEKEPLTDDIKHIEVGSIEDWEYCLNMTNGVLSSALFLQSGDSLSARTSAIFGAANLLNLEVFLDELELYQEKIEYNDSQFVQVLQKYWGNAAQFRPLLFYKDPDRSQETEIITQGQIIAEIVDQCEAAQDGDIFSNICVDEEKGLVFFKPDSRKDVVGAEKMSYDEYLDVQLASLGHTYRSGFANGIFNYLLEFKGQIEKVKPKHICFKRIFISGMYSDGVMFDDKEDHVWMDKSGFEEYNVGDSVSFSAEVYRYVKTGNGKRIDYGLRNPTGIQKIEAYELPSDNALIMQKVEQLICETCFLSEQCNHNYCTMNPKKKRLLKQEMFRAIKARTDKETQK